MAFPRVTKKSHDRGRPCFTSKAAMDTQNVQEAEAESDVVTFLRRGGISILEALAVKLPDVFAAEILPKLDMTDTLRLAQVNKAYNDAVWSVGRRSVDGGEDQGTLC